jgi:hypothetical protein
MSDETFIVVSDPTEVIVVSEVVQGPRGTDGIIGRDGAPGAPGVDGVMSAQAPLSLVNHALSIDLSAQATVAALAATQAALEAEIGSKAPAVDVTALTGTVASLTTTVGDKATASALTAETQARTDADAAVRSEFAAADAIETNARIAAIAAQAATLATEIQNRQAGEAVNASAIQTLADLDATKASLDTKADITALAAEAAVRAAAISAIQSQLAADEQLLLGKVFTVASQTAMLALAAEPGTIAVRSDLGQTYALSALPATTLANWVLLATPTDAVLSVNGKTSVVTLTAVDVGAATPADLTAAVTPLATTAALNTEITARTQGDATLNSAIGSEQAARIAADSAHDTAISSETTARLAGDASLQSSVTTNTASIGANATAIAAETTARTAADTSIRTDFAAADTAEATARANAVTYEASTRATADTALSGRIDTNTANITTNASAISTETANRTNADTSIRTDFAAADSAEATARANAVASEASTRAAADTALDGRVTTNTNNIASNTTAIAGKAATTNIYDRSTSDARFAPIVVPWASLSGIPATFAPSAHKLTHATGGTDALAPSDIGALANSGAVAGSVNYGQANGTFLKRTLTVSGPLSLTEYGSDSTLRLVSTALDQSAADMLYPRKATTIAGYGITDFNSLGDTRWLQKVASPTYATGDVGISSTQWRKLLLTYTGTTAKGGVGVGGFGMNFTWNMAYDYAASQYKLDDTTKAGLSVELGATGFVWGTVAAPGPTGTYTTVASLTTAGVFALPQVGSKLGIGRTPATYALEITGDAFSTGSFRANGTGAFLFETYGGGWQMTDTVWLHSYADKNVYTAGQGSFGSMGVGTGLGALSAKLHVAGDILATTLMRVSAGASTYRALRMSTGLADRVYFSANNTAEGSNSGSDVEIGFYTDAGANFAGFIMKRAASLAASVSTFYTPLVANLGLGVNTGATALGATLDVNGDLRFTSCRTAIVTKAAAYTLTSSDSTVRANAATGIFTLTLPDATLHSGREFFIKKIDSTANAITVATTASQTIDGAATASLTTQYQILRLQSNGAGWDII